MRRVVYCEQRFLEQFLEESPYRNMKHGKEGRTKSENWLKLFDFLSKSILIFDMGEKEFFQQVESCQELDDLWTENKDGRCEFRFNDTFYNIVERFNQCNNIDCLNSMYLTSLEGTQCNEISQQLGVIVLNVNMALRSSHIYKDSGSAMAKGKKVSWDFLNNINVNCPSLMVSNSMIIADNYFLKDKNKIVNNLLPIFKYLLPESLKDDLIYDLTIYTTDQNNTLKNRYNYLSEEIQKMKPKLKFNLSINSCTTSNFHDRAIITNNLWICCGHGFDVVKIDGRIEQSTTIPVWFPFIQTFAEWGDEGWCILLNDACQVSKNNNHQSMFCWESSTEDNRLLKWYKKEGIKNRGN